MKTKQYVLDARKRAWPQLLPVPQCCATCLQLSDDGVCVVFDSAPPAEFLTQVNECEKYERDVPF